LKLNQPQLGRRGSTSLLPVGDAAASLGYPLGRSEMNPATVDDARGCERLPMGDRRRDSRCGKEKQANAHPPMLRLS